MRSRSALAAASWSLVAALLLLLPAVSSAVGPADGAYLVTETFPGDQKVTSVWVVIQTGTELATEIAFVVLAPGGGGWTYAFGTGLTQPDGSISTAGLLLLPSGLPYGQFEITFLPVLGRLIGTATYTADGGTLVAVDGARFR